MEFDMIALLNGTVLHTHPPERCAGRPCCIHHPSAHPLRDRPLVWRPDMGIMERVCPHGIGHPDPDDIMVRRFRIPGAHSCDGCCVDEHPVMWSADRRPGVDE